MKKRVLPYLTMITLILSFASAARAAAPLEGENEVRAFVSEWFSLFDRNAPVEAFLDRLEDRRLVMDFPGSPLRSHADFRKWYRGILDTIAKANHTIKSLTVRREHGGAYAVDLIVLWQARDNKGKSIEFLARQNWKLTKETGQRLKIREYLVSAAGPEANPQGPRK